MANAKLYPITAKLQVDLATLRLAPETEAVATEAASYLLEWEHGSDEVEGLFPPGHLTIKTRSTMLKMMSNILHDFILHLHGAEQLNRVKR